ncbi:MAG: RidA family protein [Rhodoblastus sp.]|nr:MAG: RidA family protein [Rhodoblastus sp.]
MTERTSVFSGSPYEDVFGYCRAVRVGDQIHVAGTCAPAGFSATTYDQSKAALAVIGAALSELGSDFSDVVRTVVYVKDIADEAQVARAHSEIFARIRPAATMVQVSAMLRPWHRVEIEAYAVAGAKASA